MAKTHLTLTTFEDGIDQEVADRGYDFYTEGRVTQVFHISDTEWRAVVQAYDDHAVMAVIQKNRILKWYCDCSEVSEKNICRHVAALLYFIREEGEFLTVTDKSGFEAIKDSLSYLPPHALRYIILKYAASSSEYRKFLKEYFDREK